MLHRCMMALIAYIILSGSSFAFESAEHCSMSNLAITIAFDAFESKHPLDQMQSANKRIWNSTKQSLNISLEYANPHTLDKYCFPEPWRKHGVDTDLKLLVKKVLVKTKHADSLKPTYGKIVALVDYTLNPADLFVAVGEQAISPAKTADLNPDYFSTPSDLALDVASHNNADHFQANALFLFNRWHSNALNAARQGGEGALFRALAYSAVADHFLQDSFAPGHLITPRGGMYDPVALSWHDAFNADGREVAIRNWASLKTLAKFVEDNANKYTDSFQLIGYSLGKRQRTSISDALRMLAGDEDSSNGRATGSCNPKLRAAPASSSFIKFLHIEKPTALDLDESLVAKFAPSDNGEPLPNIFCVYGDGSLDQQHQGNRVEDIARQKALMLLVETQYILNILEAYANPEEPLDTSYGYIWCPMMATTPGEDSTSACTHLLTLARLANADNGNSNLHDVNGSTISDVFMAPTAVTPYYVFLSTPGTHDLVDKIEARTSQAESMLYTFHAGEISGNQRISPIAGAEIGQQIIGFTSFDNQGFARTDSEWSTLFAEGAEVHLSHTSASSYALTFRPIFALPSLDFQLSPYGKLENIGNGAVRRFRWGYGLRSDLGFSLVSFYLTIGEEPRMYEPLRTVHGLAVGTGVSVSITGSRLLDMVLEPFRSD